MRRSAAKLRLRLLAPALLLAACSESWRTAEEALGAAQDARRDHEWETCVAGARFALDAAQDLPEDLRDDALRALGAGLAGLADEAGALEAFAAAEAHPDHSPAGAADEIQAWISAGDYERALPAITRAVERFPEERTRWIGLEKTAKGLMDPATAVEALGQLGYVSLDDE